MSHNAAKLLRDALEAGPIERIEIELMPNSQFRWKLWCGGGLAYCAAGIATASEIDSMIQATDIITRKTLGVIVTHE